jgi:LEA14-like dessication related protein
MRSTAWRRVAWSLLLLEGCTPLGLWIYDDPVVTVSHITLEFGQSGRAPAPVVVALALQNLNDYPLSTERMELSLRLDGVPMGQLKRDSIVPVATDTISTVALPLVMTRQASPERLRALGSGTHTFAVRGQATFRTPIGTRKVRFAQEGSLIFATRQSDSSP